MNTFYFVINLRHQICLTIHSVLASLLALVLFCSASYSQGIQGVMSDLVRGATKITDDIPTKKVDDIVAELKNSRVTRELVDKELITAGKITDRSNAARTAARSDEVLHLLRSITAGLDPSVFPRLQKLDDASRDVALVLARGSEELSRTVPDLATRGRLVREGGLETVAATGLYGPDVARTAIRIDEAIKGGTIVVKEGNRAVTVADFGYALTKYKDASWRFWNTYVQPHWKVWAASGALAAYLNNPEYFQDLAGDLTEAGLKNLTEFVGEVIASGIRGTGTGSGKAIEDIVDAANETFFRSNFWLYPVIGTIIFLGCISLLFRRVRYWVFRLFLWLNRTPKSS